MDESRRIATDRQPEVAIRRLIRIVSMLSEPHKGGFQRLRAMPHLSPSGLYWRYLIALTTAFHSNHGALVSQSALERIAEDSPSSEKVASASWTTGMENKPFDWHDAGHDGAREMAARFVQRFPRFALLGEG